MKWFSFLILITTCLMVSCQDVDKPPQKETTPLNLNDTTLLPQSAFPPSPPLAETESLNRQLHKNWNLVSFPIKTPTHLVNFFSFNTYDQIQSVWEWDPTLGESGDWKVFPQTGDFAFLTEVVPEKGYWVKATTNFEWSGTGLAQNTYQFSKGWNLVGYSHSVADIAVSGFFEQGNYWAGSCGTGDTVINAWAWKDSQWHVYFPDDMDRETFNTQHGVNFQKLSTLESGMGLWVQTARSGGTSDGSCPTESVVGTTLQEKGFVLMTPGTFTMGDETGDLSEAQPTHVVTLTKAYYISDHEVTLSEFRPFRSDVVSDFGCTDETCPASFISWNEAQSFVAWLNQNDPLPNSYQYRLCTEAEWEYAARGGTTTKWSCGDDDACLLAEAWYNANTSQVHPVKTKQPNAFGLYDMQGNLREWVEDTYSTYQSTAVSDPISTSGNNRVWRGGNWCLAPNGIRVAKRNQLAPGSTNHVMGFRLCASFHDPKQFGNEVDSSDDTDTSTRSPEILYQGCVVCHGTGGGGTQVGPQIRSVAVTIAKINNMWEDRVAGFTPLTTAEAEALVTYVKNLNGISP